MTSSSWSATLVDQLFAPFFHVGNHIFRNVFNLVFQTDRRSRPKSRLSWSANRQRLRTGLHVPIGKVMTTGFAPKHVFNLLDHTVKIRADAVQLC